jgi:hypothetical protein
VRLHLKNKNENKRVGGGCSNGRTLAYVRPWVQSSIPQKERERRKRGRGERERERERESKGEKRRRRRKRKKERR